MKVQQRLFWHFEHYPPCKFYAVVIVLHNFFRFWSPLRREHQSENRIHLITKLKRLCVLFCKRWTNTSQGRSYLFACMLTCRSVEWFSWNFYVWQCGWKWGCPTLKFAMLVIVADKIKSKNKFWFSQNWLSYKERFKMWTLLIYTACVWNSFVFHEWLIKWCL